MNAVLLDANVLIAASVERHVHAEAAQRWLADHDEAIATTPITQGALIRHLLRERVSTADALAGLDLIVSQDRHRFWPDDRPFSRSTWRGVVGHRQVTAAYLAEQARARGGRLATFDRGLAAAHPDVAELIAS